MFCKEIFCQNLKKLRKTHGWNAQTFAKEFGTGKSTVSRWESGERFPSMDTIWTVSYTHLDVYKRQINQF